MGTSFGALVLGVLVGGTAAIVASAMAAHESLYYSRNILCLVIGAGSGAVSGAVVGGTKAIVDAIERDRQHEKT
jgi:hypothetical protein